MAENDTAWTTQNVSLLKYCFKPHTAYTIIALNLLFVIIGVFNNCLIVMIVWKTKSMQNPTNLLLSNNAVTETIFLLVAGCELALRMLTWSDISLASFLYFNIESAPGCLVLVMSVSYLVAATNLALLALQRYNALCNPMKVHRKLGKRNTKIFMLMMWLVIATLIVPAFVNHMREEGFLARKYCIYFSILSAIFSVAAGWSIVYCYGTIIYGIYISKTILSQTCGVPLSEDLKAKRNILKLLIAIALTFFSTKFPLVVYFTVTVAIQHQGSHFCFLVVFVRTLAIVSAFLSPVVYLVFNTNYRQGALRLLRSCPCRKNSIDSQHENNVIPKRSEC